MAFFLQTSSSFMVSFSWVGILRVCVCESFMVISYLIILTYIEIENKPTKRKMPTIRIYLI